MAIAYVAQSSSVTNTITDPSSAPAQCVIGLYSDDEAPLNPITATSGYTQDGYVYGSPDGGNYATVYKGSSGGVGGTLTFFNGFDRAICLLAYSGVDTTTPLDATTTALTTSGRSTATWTFNAPSITTVTDGAKILVFVAFDFDATTTAVSGTATASGLTFTQRALYNSGANFSSGLVFEASQTTHGATGTIAISITLAGAITGTALAWTSALRPAAGGGGATVYAPLDIPTQRRLATSGSTDRALTIAPVGALLAAATLTSVAWANPVQLQARALVTNRPTIGPIQPIGVGNFALTKFTHTIDVPTRAARVVRAAEPLAPIGAQLALAGLSSLGWLVIDTAAHPPAPRSAIVPDGAPSGSGFQATLSSVGWVTCDAPPKAALAATRDQRSVGADSPLRPFVSTSFGWGASTHLPYDAPLIARSVSESSPTGALFATALASAGWQANILAVRAAPRAAIDQLAPGPVGPLSPFVSLSAGWLNSDFPARSWAAPVKPAEPSQAHVGGPLLFGGTPWDAPALPRQAAILSRAEISAPVGSLLQQTLPSLGWLDAATRASALSAPRVQDPAQPSSALMPFVSASTGWLVTPLPYDTPLFGKVVADSSPTGTLLTPQPMGWAFGPDQAKPLPPVPRRADPVTPVGTPFAIALTSNGWLATDNPRTPLALGHSVPTDPVGNLLVLPPLPTLTWLSTENPRTPYRTTRAVIIDPVGTKIALPGALGPYWFVDLAPKAASAAARVAVSDPIGSAFASLSSLGWLAPSDLPRVARSRPFAFTSDPLNALQFGGAPWATVDVQPGRAAVARYPEAVAPIGSLVPISLPGFGWAPIGLPPTRPATRADAAVSSPVGSLIGAAGLTSLGWLVAVLPSGAVPRVAPAFTSDAFSALQFGGAPWATVEPQRAALTRQAQSFDSGPFGSPFAGSLSSLGWLSVQADAPRLTPPVTVPAAPVGLLIPPPILPSMGFQSSVELPPRWHFVARPIPSEPIGSSFALGFSVAPLSRCSPLFDTTGNGRLSPIFDETR